MFLRPLLKLGTLVAAVAVPYVAFNTKLKENVGGQWSRLTSAAPAEIDPLAFLPERTKAPAAALATSAAPQAPVPTTVSLEEALRFDVTPEWVTARWPHVSSVVGEDKQVGLRVVLVSGTTPSDVAGSLTYYFDQQHQLQRLTLLGVSGDESRLAALATGKFGLRPTQTSERGLYYGGDVNRPTSSLLVSNLPVVRADAPHARLQVALDLKRPDVSRLKTETERPAKQLPQAYRRW